MATLNLYFYHLLLLLGWVFFVKPELQRTKETDSQMSECADNTYHFNMQKHTILLSAKMKLNGYVFCIVN